MRKKSHKWPKNKDQKAPRDRRGEDYYTLPGKVNRFNFFGEQIGKILNLQNNVIIT